ncbi:glycosyltransferase [Actinomycetospora lutea]|uniref:glycosyltransferase n=1 Tax=Actinomycetospora lutea TaxID=663604 RepID=UPI002366EB21|nr:glycosyltransferase [Actinomycetospora lutea]MDD7940819.1 glycosyltransferase [Actinomycetospora lutea]
MAGTTERRGLAVLIISPARAELLDRALGAVDKWLPDARVHVWDNRDAATPAIREVAARRPDVTWTFWDADLGPVTATNRLMAQVPEHDALLLDPAVELLGPLARAREVLAEAGVAAVSPTVLDAHREGRPWDMARRPQSIVRGLVDVAGWSDSLRGRRVSELYATAPDRVDGHLLRRCLLVSRDAYDAVGRFDERFFDGGEEAAWQRAALAAGWTLRLVDDPEPQARWEAPDDTEDTAGVDVPADERTVRRPDDLRRAARTMGLGIRNNAGRGALFAAGASLLDRVQPVSRARRRRERTAAAARAGDRPAVVVISNGLELGGAERQRVMLANELLERGHPVTVVALQKLGPYTAELDPRVRLLLQPFWQPLVDVPTDEAILVSGVTNTEIGFALGWRAQGRLHGERRLWMPASHDPAELGGPTYTDRQARALRAADALLVLARQHHDDLTRFQPLTDTVMIAPNGIPAAAERSYAPATEGGPVRFGMVTRIVEYKNPLLLADALDALDRPGDWTLDIFGEGPDRADLEARTPPHLAGKVRWRGRAFGPDEAFGQIDVLCVPSGFEAFPLVMVEAMMRGVPVMASVSGAVPEMLDGGRAGVMVDPLTRERWTEALRAVIDDPAGTAALGAAGRDRALSHYTVAAMADDYQRAFVRLLGHPFTGAPAEPARTL